MKKYILTLGGGAFFLFYILVTHPVLALESPTQAYLLSSKEPLWRIEISSNSFDHMIKSIDQNDPIRSTLESIRIGFSELRREKDPHRVLAFEWHTTSDQKTMCKLYRVGGREQRNHRQLFTRKAYANIEHRNGSCRDQGRHIQQLVVLQRTYTMLASGMVWGATVAQHDKIKQYWPTFIHVHSTKIPIGMIPMSRMASAKSGIIPANEWTTWKSEKIFEKLSASGRIKWKGIEIKADTAPISIAVWQKWTAALSSKLMGEASNVKWPDAKSRIDTPPVYIGDWQQSMFPSVALDPLVKVTNWNKVNLAEMGWKVRENYKWDSWERAIMAAYSSKLIYGTPDYAVLIDAICPLDFLSGTISCILPELKKAKAAKIYLGRNILKLRVALSKGKEGGSKK